MFECKNTLISIHRFGYNHKFITNHKFGRMDGLISNHKLEYNHTFGSNNRFGCNHIIPPPATSLPNASRCLVELAQQPRKKNARKLVGNRISLSINNL
jgi:hypothetical protein